MADWSSVAPSEVVGCEHGTKATQISTEVNIDKGDAPPLQEEIAFDTWFFEQCNKLVGSLPLADCQIFLLQQGQRVSSQLNDVVFLLLFIETVLRRHVRINAIRILARLGVCTSSERVDDVHFLRLCKVCIEKIVFNWFRISAWRPVQILMYVCVQQDLWQTPKDSTLPSPGPRQRWAKHNGCKLHAIFSVKVWLQMCKVGLVCPP